jgi:hypothetical protein
MLHSRIVLSNDALANLRPLVFQATLYTWPEKSQHQPGNMSLD